MQPRSAFRNPETDTKAIIQYLLRLLCRLKGRNGRPDLAGVGPANEHPRCLSFSSLAILTQTDTHKRGVRRVVGGDACFAVAAVAAAAIVLLLDGDVGAPSCAGSEHGWDGDEFTRRGGLSIAPLVYMMVCSSSFFFFLGGG